MRLESKPSGSVVKMDDKSAGLTPYVSPPLPGRAKPYRFQVQGVPGSRLKPVLVYLTNNLPRPISQRTEVRLVELEALPPGLSHITFNRLLEVSPRFRALVPYAAETVVR